MISLPSFLHGVSGFSLPRRRRLSSFRQGSLGCVRPSTPLTRLRQPAPAGAPGPLTLVPFALRDSQPRVPPGLLGRRRAQRRQTFRIRLLPLRLHLAFPLPFLEYEWHLVFILAFPLASWVLAAAELPFWFAFPLVSLAGVCRPAPDAHLGVWVWEYVPTVSYLAALLT